MMASLSSSKREQESADDDGGGVELFLDHGDTSKKPFILAPRTPVKESKRRWRLLRNAVRFTGRRSSLTKAEEDLMQALNKSKHKQQDIASSACNHRHQLRQSIAYKTKDNLLTEAEQTFLESLVTAEDVTTQHIQTIEKVLKSDPLYDSMNSSEFFAIEHDPKRATVRKDRPKLSQDGPSFRKEVWTDYVSNSTTSLVNGESSNKEDVRNEEENNAPQPKREASLMETLFGRVEKEDVPEESPQDMNENLMDPPRVILATHASDERCAPHVMSPPIMDALRPHLPFVVQEDNFWLKYSMMRDGASMRALLRNIRSSARTIIAIETTDGDVFGSFTSSPWRPNGRGYYGSGESFTWRLSHNRYTPCETPRDQIALEQKVQVFSWTGQNRNVQSLASVDSQLVLGGGSSIEEASDGGFALCIDSTLFRGTSDPCLTFNNPKLSTKEVFDIANVEVWTLTPVESLDQAEQLELGRQFVFDHGNFVEQ